jgi:hypothetical protein
MVLVTDDMEGISGFQDYFHLVACQPLLCILTAGLQHKQEAELTTRLVNKTAGGGRA